MGHLLLKTVGGIIELRGEARRNPPLKNLYMLSLDKELL